MKDIKSELQPAYLALLSGNVVIPATVFPFPFRPDNDYTVPVYEYVPSEATYPYIGFQEYTETDDSDKSSFGADETFALEIVDQYENEWSTVARNYLLNRFKEIIVTGPVPL